MSLRVGVINRFRVSDLNLYRIGQALEAERASWIPLPLSRFHVVRDNARGVPAACFLDRDGDIALERDLPSLGLAGILWRVSENIWSASRDLIEALEPSHRMINSAACIRVCSDKWLTYLALTAAGIPTVATRLVLPGAPAPRMGTDMTVIKPAVGAGGRDVRAIRPGEVTNGTELLVAQPLLAAPAHTHVRVLVCGGQPVAAIHRVPPSESPTDSLTVNNIDVGGTPVPADLAPVADLAEIAATTVDGHIVSVELVPDMDGKMSVLEVNSAPGLDGIGSVSAVNCYETVAKAVVKMLNE